MEPTVGEPKEEGEPNVLDPNPGLPNVVLLPKPVVFPTKPVEVPPKAVVLPPKPVVLPPKPVVFPKPVVVLPPNPDVLPPKPVVFPPKAVVFPPNPVVLLVAETFPDPKADVFTAPAVPPKAPVGVPVTLSPSVGGPIFDCPLFGTICLACINGSEGAEKGLGPVNFDREAVDRLGTGLHEDDFSKAGTEAPCTRLRFFII